MKRSSHIEKAQRINEARRLIQKQNTTSKVAVELAKQFSIPDGWILKDEGYSGSIFIRQEKANGKKYIISC